MHGKGEEELGSILSKMERRIYGDDLKTSSSGDLKPRLSLVTKTRYTTTVQLNIEV
jgi:hypothetical protein